MIVKIENEEVMTSLEARKKYDAKYIGTVTIEQKLTDPDNELVLILYTADTYDEMYEIPAKTEKGTYISLLTGMSVGGMEIGGVCFDE